MVGEEVGEEGGARRRRREMANGSDERMSVVQEGEGKEKVQVDLELGDELGDDGRARRQQREMSCEKELESRERSVRRVRFC
jgi:hypothetical protein